MSMAQWSNEPMIQTPWSKSNLKQWIVESRGIRQANRCATKQWTRFQKQWNISSAAADPNSKLWNHMEIVIDSMVSGSYACSLWLIGQLVHWSIAWLILTPSNRATNHCGQETTGPPPTNHRGWVVSTIHWSNHSLMIHWYIDSASLMHWCIDSGAVALRLIA